MARLEIDTANDLYCVRLSRRQLLTLLQRLGTGSSGTIATRDIKRDSQPVEGLLLVTAEDDNSQAGCGDVRTSREDDAPSNHAMDGQR